MKKRHGVLLFLVVLAVITFLDRIGLAVSGLRIQQELGIPPERWGWILGVFVFAYGAFAVPSGALGDRFGRHSVLAGIVLWWSTFTCLAGTATTFVSLLLACFMFGVGEAGAYPNISGALARWFPATERARAQGYIWAASRVGGALAPLLIVSLRSVLGWRATFAVLGAVGMIWALWWWAWYHDHPAQQPGITREELEEVASLGALALDVRVPWGALLRHRQIWLIFTMYWCYAWGSWFYMGWFPVYLVNGAGFTEANMGFVSSVPFLLSGLGNIAGGFLSDRLVMRFGLKTGRRLIGCLSLAAASFLLIGMAVARGGAAVIVFSSLAFGVMDLMLPTAWAMCLDIGGRHAGVVTGALNTAGQFGGFVCSVLFGYVVRATGDYHAPVWVVAGMVMVSAIVFTRIDPTCRLVQEDVALGQSAS